MIVDFLYLNSKSGSSLNILSLLLQTGKFALPILLGPLSPEEAKALQCLADDVTVRSEIHAFEPTSRRT